MIKWAAFDFSLDFSSMLAVIISKTMTHWEKRAVDYLGMQLRWSNDPCHQTSQTAHRPSATRDSPSTPRFNSLLLFSFLQKWNRNFKHLKFHTGNDIEATDTSRAKHSVWVCGVCRGCAKRRSGKADDQAQRKQSFAEQVGELQTSTHADKEKQSCVDTGVFICFHAAGARCWLARLDIGMFCLIPEQPWLHLWFQLCPWRPHGWPEPLNVLLKAVTYRPLNGHDLVKNQISAP